MLKQALLLFSLLLIVTGQAAADPRTVTLGGIFDLTSPAGSQWGVDERDGFLAAIDDFQKANPDWHVDYKIEDSAYSNIKSVAALQKLSGLDGIKFVIGPTWETFVATAPICERKKIICFAPSDHSVLFHDPDKPLKYNFTAFFDERDYATTLADRMVKDGRKRVAIFSTISAYFETLSAAFLGHFPEKPAFFERLEPGFADFKSLIARTPKDVDALFLILDGTSGQNYLFLTQWLGLRSDKPVIYSHDGILYEPNWEKIKKLGFTIEVSKPFIEPALQNAWSKKFKERFKREPSAPSGEISYDETMITLGCIKSQGTDTAKVRECISATNNYHGLSGVLSFNGGQTVMTRVFEIQEVRQ